MSTNLKIGDKVLLNGNTEAEIVETDLLTREEALDIIEERENNGYGVVKNEIIAEKGEILVETENDEFLLVMPEDIEKL